MSDPVRGPLLVGGPLYGLQVPTRWTTVPLFVLSTALAVVDSFGGRLLVSLLAFWLVDVRGVLTLYVLTTNVLCGLLVPVHFLPGWAQAIAYATPFPSMLQVPLDMATERFAAAAVAAVSARTELRDLTIAEPDIDDVVARSTAAPPRPDRPQWSLRSSRGTRRVRTRRGW